MCCPCCDNTLDLGCFDPCDLVFDAGISDAEGEWELRLTYGRRFLFFTNDLIVGQPIRFALDNINENYTYTAQITKPDGTIFTYTQGEEIYDCFKFTTKINGKSEIAL